MKWLTLYTPTGGKFQVCLDIESGLIRCRKSPNSEEWCYRLQAIPDLYRELCAHKGWVKLGSRTEYDTPVDDSVEAWARSRANPVHGYYGVTRSQKGRFATYVPPILEHLGLASVEHEPLNNRIRAVPGKARFAEDWRPERTVLPREAKPMTATRTFTPTRGLPKTRYAKRDEPKSNYPTKTKYPTQNVSKSRYPTKNVSKNNYVTKNTPKTTYATRNPAKSDYPAKKTPKTKYPTKNIPKTNYTTRTPTKSGYSAKKTPKLAYPTRKPVPVQRTKTPARAFNPSTPTTPPRDNRQSYFDYFDNVVALPRSKRKNRTTTTVRANTSGRSVERKNATSSTARKHNRVTTRRRPTNTRNRYAA